MAIQSKKLTRKPRDLLRDRLEMVSKELFKKFYPLITELVSDSPGIYALYDGEDLYYVGKSIDLRKRVRQHLRDRHLASWTHFSLYLVRREEHIHEIESLLVRIANPKGNRVVPRGKSRGTLLKALDALIRKKHRDERAALLGLKPARGVASAKKHGNHPSTLEGLVSKPATLFREYKGKEYTARLSPAGTITYRGKRYFSPSEAAQAIIGPNRAVSGWVFWYIKDVDGNVVRLEDYRE